MSNEKLEDMVDEIVEDKQEETNTDIPSCTDPKWVDYILDNLADHELANGNPTTDGIRRVTEKVFGEIIYSDSQVLEVPERPLSGKATVKHTLTVQKYENGQSITVSACVDVLGDKLPYPFKEHLVSTACTRAEGKALRRALKIRVLTAEELAHTEEDGDVSMDMGSLINDQQILALKTMCKRLDVNLVKFVKANSSKAQNIKGVKAVECSLMINKLSEFQRESVPKEFSGWSSSWEEEFGG